jgi:aryl-alcohol dehydrogenase-like predicted oxidoreductase
MEGLDWLKDKNFTAERIEKVKKLTQLAKDLDLNLPVMSLAWCLKNPHVSTVILGASKEQQLVENLKAIEAKKMLTDEVMEKIDTILQNSPVKPAF